MSESMIQYATGDVMDATKSAPEVESTIPSVEMFSAETATVSSSRLEAAVDRTVFKQTLQASITSPITTTVAAGSTYQPALSPGAGGGIALAIIIVIVATLFAVSLRCHLKHKREVGNHSTSTRIPEPNFRSGEEEQDQAHILGNNLIIASYARESTTLNTPQVRGLQPDREPQDYPNLQHFNAYRHNEQHLQFQGVDRFSRPSEQGWHLTAPPPYHSAALPSYRPRSEVYRTSHVH